MNGSVRTDGTPPGAAAIPSRGLERFTDLPLALAVDAAGTILRRVGPAAGYRFARFAGDVWYWLVPRRRKVAHRNLEIALGDAFSGPAREEIAQGSYRHAMATAVGVFLRDGALTPENLGRWFSSDPHLEQLLARPHPRGLAFLSAHLGDWEMMIQYVVMRGLPVTAVSRRIHNPHLDRRITRLRSSHGASVIHKDGGLWGLWKVLRSGGAVGLMADQSAPAGERNLEFFGVRSATYFRYARLLARAMPEVAFVACVREGLSFRFRIIARDLTGALYGGGSEEERAERLVRAYLGALEEAIRACPEQYLWMHRRWKRRPEGAPDLYRRLGEPLDPRLLAGEQAPLRRVVPDPGYPFPAAPAENP